MTLRYFVVKGGSLGRNNHIILAKDANEAWGLYIKDTGYEPISVKALSRKKGIVYRADY